MIVVGLLQDEEAARYATREELAILFGVTRRTIVNWIQEWKATRIVRLYYAPSEHGPVLKAQLDDVINWAKSRRQDFSNEFRKYMLADEYDSGQPDRHDANIWSAICSNAGLLPSELSKLGISRQ